MELENRLREFENRAFRRIFGRECETVTRRLRKLLYNSYSLPNTIFA